MSFDPNDERLTAYALGDDSLSPADRKAVEQLVSEHAEAKELVADLRAVADLLKNELAHEPSPPRDARLVGAIDQALAAKKDGMKSKSRFGLWATFTALGLVVAAGFATVYVQRSGPMMAMLDRKAEPQAKAMAPAARSMARREREATDGESARPTAPKMVDKLADLASALHDAPNRDKPMDASRTQGTAPPDPTRFEELSSRRRKVPESESAPAEPAKPTAPAPGPAGPASGGRVTSRMSPRSLAVRERLAEADHDRFVDRLEGLADGEHPLPATPAPKGGMAGGQPGIGGGMVPNGGMGMSLMKRRASAAANTEAYGELKENEFIPTIGERALSTFSIDVDTASYSNMRRFLNQNALPPAGAVRVEEFINYFPYSDAPPDGADPFGARVEVAECPWAPKHKLARIALKAKPIAYKSRPASNLVFLIDVSGSMNSAERLPLVKTALKLLVDELTENDRVALVVYAGNSGLVLDSTSCYRRPEIMAALDRLEAGGSTNGGAGIQQAYNVAVQHFIKGGVNRVILCTDGDWNVGTTSNDELFKLITDKAKTGVFLSVLGFGMGNLKDQMMVGLADKGNGNYAYIDSAKEAKKVLVEQMGGTLITVAKDVKIQIEFNPAQVAAYRLIGYEKRLLKNEDFHNDKKDAGEIGAGHNVTALYELVPPGLPVDAPKVDGLKYQPNPAKPAAKAAAPAAPASKELLTLKLRFKPPEGDVSVLRQAAVTDAGVSYTKASEDFRFSAAVASYGMLLRDSPHKGNATYASVKELAAAAPGKDPGGYRAEFLTLVDKAKGLSGKP